MSKTKTKSWFSNLRDLQKKKGSQLLLKLKSLYVAPMVTTANRILEDLRNLGDFRAL